MELKFEDLPRATSLILERLERIENLLLGNSDKPKLDSDKPLTVNEAAEFLELSPQTIYGFMSRRVIPYLKPGKRCYFLKQDLINYLKESRQKSHKEIVIEAENFIIQRKRKYK